MAAALNQLLDNVHAWLDGPCDLHPSRHPSAPPARQRSPSEYTDAVDVVYSPSPAHEDPDPAATAPSARTRHCHRRRAVQRRIRHIQSPRLGRIALLDAQYQLARALLDWDKAMLPRLARCDAVVVLQAWGLISRPPADDALAVQPLLGPGELGELGMLKDRAVRKIARSCHRVWNMTRGLVLGSTSMSWDRVHGRSGKLWVKPSGHGRGACVE